MLFNVVEVIDGQGNSIALGERMYVTKRSSYYVHAYIIIHTSSE